MEKIDLIDPPMQSARLADGRQLTWQEFGLPGGRPVLYFHGGGSISLEAGIFHREAVQNNIRLIATNRPGAGGSTACPGRPVAGYSDDLRELLDGLKIDRFACFGESNGGTITLAVAATMAPRTIGAIPINPTVPWLDPLARSVSRSVAIAYRLMKYWPGLLTKAAAGSADRLRRQRAEAPPSEAFSRLDLLGPPPGIEQDVGEFQWRVMAQPARKQALLAELRWAASDWGAVSERMKRTIKLLQYRHAKLEADAAAHDNHLSADIIAFGNAKEIDAARGFLGRAGATERHHRLQRAEHRGGNARLDRLALDLDHGRRVIVGLG
jgi:pimeloyl-ACP methyl ester carboxylesterase